jgi:hypothetical protein
MIIPKYNNTLDKSNILEDTIKFLYEVIGCFIQVEIKLGVPKILFKINQTMVKDQSLSDNARCYTQCSIPSQKREYGIWKAIEDMCRERTISDRIFFIALGDYPILQSNKSTHPHWLRYTSGNYLSIYPNNMFPIYSRSIIPLEHEDKLFPTRDFIDMVYGMENILSKINKDFVSKKPIAVFRGSITGHDRTITNTRVQAKILSLRYPDYLDVELTKTFDYYMFEENSTLCVLTNIMDKIIYDPKASATKSLSGFEQFANYRYLLHIDGFVSAWRLGLELLSFSLILKVDSPWIEHYYSELIPWIHYIPVKSDLSDLIQIIEWCNNNVITCNQITTNAYNYAKANFTKSKLFDYLEGIEVYDLYKNYFSPISIPTFDDNFTYAIKPNQIEFNEINNPEYSRYLLPQLEPEPEYPPKIPNNFFQFETIISEKLCDIISEYARQIGVYKSMGKSIVYTTGLYTDIGDNFNKLCNEVKEQINQELYKSNLDFELGWINSNFIFSNNPVYSYMELFDKLNQFVLVVFLNTDYNQGYRIDNSNGTWIQSLKGRVVLFDPKIHFVTETNFTESFQLLFPVSFTINKWDRLGLFEKYYWIEAPNYDESIKMLYNNIEYTDVIKNRNELSFITINKNNNLGGVWFWDNFTILVDINLVQVKNIFQTQIKFNPSDMIKDWEIWLNGTRLNTSNCYITICGKIYHPDEIICLNARSTFVLNPEDTCSLNIKNLILPESETDLPESDRPEQKVSLEIRYKSFLLVNNLRKFIASA